jgi:hypothetical protein
MENIEIFVTKVRRHNVQTGKGGEVAAIFQTNNIVIILRSKHNRSKPVATVIVNIRFVPKLKAK